MNSQRANDYIIGKMEEKLKEFMPKKEYIKFITKVSRDAFKIEIEDMKDCDFKDYVLENFEKITKMGESDVREIFGEDE